MRMIDSHVHLENQNPKKAVEMADHFGYEKFALMAIPCYGNPLNTLESLLAKRAGLDPAVMASPFITTIVDVLSLLIYFRFASSILHI